MKKLKYTESNIDNVLSINIGPEFIKTTFQLIEHCIRLNGINKERLCRILNIPETDYIVLSNLDTLTVSSINLHLKFCPNIKKSLVTIINNGNIIYELIGLNIDEDLLNCLSKMRMLNDAISIDEINKKIPYK